MLLLYYNPLMKLSKILTKDGDDERVKNAMLNPAKKKMLLTDGHILMILNEKYGKSTELTGIIVESDSEIDEIFLLPKELLAEYEKFAWKNRKNYKTVAIAIDTQTLTSRVILKENNEIDYLSRKFEIKRGDKDSFERLIDLYERYSVGNIEDYILEVCLNVEILKKLIDAFEFDSKNLIENKQILLRFNLKNIKNWKTKEAVYERPLPFQSILDSDLNGIIMPVLLNKKDKERIT